MPFYKIAETLYSIDFQENDLCSFIVNDKEIVLAKKDNQLFACAAICPHASFPMKDGYISSKGFIVCPKHDYQFSLLHGRCMNVEDYKLKIYKTEKRDDGWYVEI
ncbi:MAG: Rieske 2Fe-2S domain-containing protein [Arachidicoccus sp.]|nr:Rieske 2Fe-2S domain-containing protein [Arachidicoccus sp.]